MCRYGKKLEMCSKFGGKLMGKDDLEDLDMDGRTYT
jgi:hypothetical protein